MSEQEAGEDVCFAINEKNMEGFYNETRDGDKGGGYHFRYSHHREAVKELVSIFWEKEGVALVFGGSCGKAYGAARFDIDAMVVVTDDFTRRRKEETARRG